MKRVASFGRDAPFYPFSVKELRGLAGKIGEAIEILSDSSLRWPELRLGPHPNGIDMGDPVEACRMQLAERTYP